MLIDDKITDELWWYTYIYIFFLYIQWQIYALSANHLSLNIEKKKKKKRISSKVIGDFITGKHYLHKVSVWLESRSKREIVIKLADRVGGGDYSAYWKITWSCVFSYACMYLLPLWSLGRAEAKHLSIISSLLLSLPFSLLHSHYNIPLTLCK